MKTKSKAFTLIEWLVVIALLLSVILPSLKQATPSTICKSNLRQSGIIYKMYAEDYAAIFPDKATETIGLKKLWPLKRHRQYNTGGLWALARGVTFNTSEGAASWMASFEDY